MRTTALLFLFLLAASGCAQESKAPPVSMSSGGSMEEPEPANSLPLGSAVNEPLTGQAGNVGTTRVGPARTRPGSGAPARGY